MLYVHFMGRDSGTPRRRTSSTAWQRDHPWAKVYDAITGNHLVGGLLWRIGMSSDLGLLHRIAATELSALADGAAVLDLPCGGGVVLRDVPPELELRYVAADISPAMLERTREEAAKLEVAITTTEADVQALHFADAEFDLVFSFTSLHCFPDPQKAIQELARVTRPGGRFVGSALLRGGPVRHRLTWLGGGAIGILGPGCTRDELTRWLSDAGIDDVVLTDSGAITYFAGTRAR